MTGYAGQAHVSAADHGSFFAAAVRGGQFVTTAGAQFAAQVVTNNLVRISDGELVMQGRHVKLDPGSYVELAIENGAADVSRVDLIVARYTRDSSTGVEECNLAVITGTPAESNPAVPDYVDADINAADTLLAEMPLYQLRITGLNVGQPIILFNAQMSVHDELVYHVAERDNPHNVTREQVGAAPAGYGLGTTSVGLDMGANLNNVVKNGFYRYMNGPELPKNAPTEDPAQLTVYAFSDKYVVQEVTPIGTGGYKLRRVCNNGTWQPWEWVIAPMVPGVEYRTTERFNNAAVYRKIDSAGNLLWRKDGETTWHQYTVTTYVAPATVE